MHILLTILRILFTIIFLTPFAVNINIPKNPKLWLILAFGGFFGIGIRLILILIAIRYVGVVLTGIISSVLPMITIILSLVILKKSKEIKKIVGIILILAGLLILSMCTTNTAGLFIIMFLCSTFWRHVTKGLKFQCLILPARLALQKKITLKNIYI